MDLSEIYSIPINDGFQREW